MLGNLRSAAAARLPAQHKAMIKGGLTRVPVVRREFLGLGTGGGEQDARYCYSVFLRHVVRSATEESAGVVGKRVAELGPGDSLGVGMAALLAGADTYTALDAKPHAGLEVNAAVLARLVELFRARSPIPGPDDNPAFDEIRPFVDSYELPAHLLPDSLLERTLGSVESIYASLTAKSGRIRYVAPWDTADVISPGAVDFIWSQACLEHVEDLPGTYAAMARWLSPGGTMSHTIDFRSHGLHDEWNGHWSFRPITWRLIKGHYPYLLNRAQLTAHLDELSREFTVLSVERFRREDGLPAEALRPEYAEHAEDRLTATAYVVARKGVGTNSGIAPDTSTRS